MTRTLSNYCLAALVLALSLSATAQSQETGVQVDKPGLGLYGGGVYVSEQQTIDYIAKCKAAGIRVLHPSLSAGGTVLWNTDKEQYYADFQDSLKNGHDPLAVLIKHAHAAGIKVYPSVAVSPTNQLLNENPQWETRDREGELSSVTTARAVSLAYPQARAGKIAVLMDLVNGYDVDGVMLDYCRYPETTKQKKTAYGFYGYDAPLIDACQSIYGFDPREVPIDSPRWMIFNQMRVDTVTAFVREFREATRSSGRYIRVGGFSDTDANREARVCGRYVPDWARQDLIDDYYLATYTQSIDEMPDVVRQTRELAGDDVMLISALSPFNRFLTTDEELVAASKAQLQGGADSLWIYRYDYLDELKLWGGTQSVAELLSSASD